MVDYYKIQQRSEEKVEFLIKNAKEISKFMLIYNVKKEFAVSERAICRHISLLESVGKIEIFDDLIKWKEYY